MKIKTFSAIDFDNISMKKEYWLLLWEMNRAVAEAYGISPDDFEYILSTFPVIARKRPEFYAYLHEMVREWKEEVGGAGGKIKAYSVGESDELPKAAEQKESYSKSQGES